MPLRSVAPPHGSRLRQALTFSLALIATACATPRKDGPQFSLQQTVDMMRGGEPDVEYEFVPPSIAGDAYLTAKRMAYAAEGHAECNGGMMIFYAVWDLNAEVRIPDMLERIDSRDWSTVANGRITKDEVFAAEIRLYEQLCNTSYFPY